MRVKQVRAYLWLWLVEAFGHSWSAYERASAVFAALAFLAPRGRYHPQGMAGERLGHVAAIALFAVMLMGRLILAPYWIRERESEQHARIIAELERSVQNKARKDAVGQRLAEFHAIGFQVKQAIINSDDETSVDHWGDQIDAWRGECRAYLRENVSAGVAAHWDTFGSVMAIYIAGMKSNTTRDGKTTLIQRLDERLDRLSQLLKDY